MYRIFYDMGDKKALLDTEDKDKYPKGYIVDSEFNILGGEVFIDSVIKFNPYVEDPTEKEAKKRFKKIGNKFYEVI